ncbi:nitrate reductase molybdenum cofactor assembly chaperone [Moraxella marmotae]|uniref:nitrate reductase molybdenum cofactor assembly chaperone n=1 Tax=Moraxella marmotae TaxID=3344520 RepID=UPI0035F2D184
MDFKLLKVISLLLDYPDDALFDGEHLHACREIVMKSVLISPEVRQEIAEFIDELASLGNIDAQSRYDGLFERGRNLSLWLFEHVHGESRDRGQAMVDLMAQYEAAGFEIGVKELPDYLPMYLEFLAYQATQTDDDIAIRLEIADIKHILILLAARLADKNSHYVCLFKALLQIAGQPLSVIDDELSKMGKVIDDTTPAAIDAEWEEEVVNFMANNDEQCPSSQTAKRISELAGANAQNMQTQPVHWVGFNQNNTTNPTNAKGVNV